MLQNNAIKVTLFYLVSVGFILMNLWFMITRDTVVLNALPFLLVVVLLVIFSFDKLIYLVVFFAPLSVELSDLMPGFGFNMFLPTEPILAGILILFLLKIVHEQGFDRRILLHPVSLVIYLNLFWIFITSLTSSMPLVSFKFLIARIWFLVAFYFLMAKIFSEGKKLEQYVWLYLAGLMVVICYTIFRHTGYGLLNKHAAHFVMTPFYNDHTSYGAALAMYLPFTAWFAFSRTYSGRIRFAATVVFIIILFAFILSYSRAAWLSIIVAFGVLSIILLRIRFKTIAITTVVLLSLVFSFQQDIVLFLERNSDESSSNLTEHFSSMTNITTDASNLERLNRWGSAIRMFQERPVFGYGPGTYMFQYAKYQLKKDRTIISTNAGDAGNAHSEYLGPLSESGVGGLFTFLLIIVTVMYTAVNTWSRLSDYRLRGIILAALIGLVTYYIHGFLNNFLDTDKLSVPFWGFTAMIVAIDIYSRSRKADQEEV